MTRDWPAPDTRSPAAKAIAAHLRALFCNSNGGDAPGWVSILCLPSRTVVWARGDDLFSDLPERIAMLAQQENVYVGMALRFQRTAGRGTLQDILGIHGLWFDLDIQGPTHKANALPRNRDEAHAFVDSLECPPTLLIDSGGGFQLFWGFPDLQVFASPDDLRTAARLSDAFQRAMITRGAAHGWSFDNTSDLPRVLRLAGTRNHKTNPPTPVTIVAHNDVRYAPREMAAFARSAA